MGVRFRTIEEMSKMPLHKLEKRTYLDAEGKATTDESKGVSLFGIEGDEVLAEDAFRAGLLDKEPQPDEVPEPQMLYYNAEGKRVKEGDPNVANQFLDNDPTRPDSPERKALAEAQAARVGEPAKPGDYDNMKKGELVELAEARGVQPSGGENREHYIAALKQADKA